MSRSRSAGQRRLAPGLDVKARPEKRPRSLSLGLTTGITAAGAWAARFEIASMLEAKCNPNELVEAIRAGREGPHVLSMTQHEERSTVGSASAGSLQELSPGRITGMTFLWIFFGPRRLGQGIGQAEGHLGVTGS